MKKKFRERTAIMSDVWKVLNDKGLSKKEKDQKLKVLHAELLLFEEWLRGWYERQNKLALKQAAKKT